MVDVPRVWMSRVCSGDVAAVLGLYCRDAVLVPTYEPRVLRGHKQLAVYFREFLGKPGLCGRIDSEIVQGLPYDTHVFSGTYTFNWRGGSAHARYTFVVGWRPRGPRIVTHHSSETPA